MEYQNFWAKSAGMQVYCPERFFFYESKEHPLEDYLDRKERAYKARQFKTISTFLKEYELPFIDKIRKTGIVINDDRFVTSYKIWKELIKYEG